MKRLLALLAAAALAGCATAPPQVAGASPNYQESEAQRAAAAARYAAPVTIAATPPEPAKFVRVPLKSRGSTHTVMVGISGVCCFPFLLDSGASDVSISPDMFRAMVKDGVITKAHLIDVQTYRIADGSSVEGLRFRIPELNIGGLTVRNVVGSVTPGANMLLLGQSFLRRFRFWAIDNSTGELILG